MVRNKFLYLLVVLTAMFTVSCKDSEILMPNVSGAAFEVLLVMDNDVYKSEAGEVMFNILNGDVEKLPQSEPQFDISRIEYRSFDDLFRTTRSIVFVVVDPERYTKTTINFIDGRWAKTQTVVNVTAADLEDLKVVLEKNADKIVDYLVKGERVRQMDYIKENIGREALNKTYMMFGAKIAVPSSMNKFKEGENFLWMSDGSAVMQKNVVVYSAPYRSKDQLTAEGLNALRDSVMKANIPGSMEGSYMGTEYNYDAPSYEEFNFNGSWAAEIRGLWSMKEGAAMGGPYVSHAHIDEMNGRILVFEGFVFAPGKNKRNSVRQIDAMLHSVIMPHDVNAVTVAPK